MLKYSQANKHAIFHFTYRQTAPLLSIITHSVRIFLLHVSTGYTFLNKPLSFETNEYFIIVALCFVVLLAFYRFYRIHSLNIKNAQRKEIDAMTDFKNLINNIMPILYMQEELITDEKGLSELIY